MHMQNFVKIHPFILIYWVAMKCWPQSRFITLLQINTTQDKTCPMEWYMSNGQSLNLRVYLTSSDWLKVYFCIQGPAAADTSHTGNDFDQWDPRKHPVSWIVIGRKSFHWAMYLLLLNLPSKNQLSTNQNFFNTHTISQNDCWTCIIPLDMQNWCLTIPT